MSDDNPILIVPYMWIGDFVRCHTVVRLVRARFPGRPIDMLATAMVAPLIDYMPAVRKGIVFDLPRKRLVLSRHRALADLLRPERYGDALIMPRTWKAALAPFLAGIPRRTAFIGEMRFGLVNDRRGGEKKLPRMVDRCAALALPKGAALPQDLPLPQLVVPRDGLTEWRARMNLPANGQPTAVLARAPSGHRSDGEPTGRLPRILPNRALRSGSWAGLTKSLLRPRSYATRGKPAISPAPICAMPSWRLRQRPWRYRTIPGCCTWLPPSARRRSGYSGRPAPGIGPRSIRSLP